MKWQPASELTEEIADTAWRLLIMDDDDGTLWTICNLETEEGYPFVHDESGAWFIETPVEPILTRWFLALDDPEDTPIDW